MPFVQLLDLSHFIAEDMPVYPGTEGPKLMPANTYERDGFRETLLCLYSHTGTHMDAPAHLYPDGTTLDAFPVGQFVGSALVIDCRDVGLGARIGMEAIARQQELADQAEFLLFCTGWDRYWGKPEYFGAYPCVDMTVVEYMLKSGKKGIGLDTIGLDPIADPLLPLHRRLLSRGDRVILENLCGLEKLPKGLVTLCALPLPYAQADGAPARVIALW